MKPAPLPPAAYSADAGAIRVLHVVSSLHSGGMELALLRLIEAGVRQRTPLDHIVCVLRGGDEALLAQFRKHAPTHVLQKRRTAFIALRALLQRLRPDVIHARGTSTWLDACLARVNLWPAPRLILGFHGLIDASGPSSVRRLLLRACTGAADCVVVPSRDAMRLLSGKWGVSRRKLQIIPNGVDTVQFRPPDPLERARLREDLGIPGDAHVVACVANLVPIKSHDVLLQAWRQVVMVAPGAILLLAGDGPLRTELECMTQRLRCANSVHFLGRRRNVATVLGASDLFVLPSRYEGSSNALLEAMSCGLPVIATAVGGNLDTITPHSTGWMLPAGDPHRLAELMIAALLEADARRRVGAAAREEVERRFSAAAWREGVARLYVRVVRGDIRESLLNMEGMACVE